MLFIAQTALELGFMYALVSMALYLSYRVLDIADLSTDGTFVLGMAVSVSLAAAGHPILAIPAAMAAGACAGFVTAFLQTKLGVPSILAGIVTNTGLYTINLMAMGWSSNVNLLKQETIFTKFRALNEFGGWYEFVLAALILGGFYGGLAGAIGMTIGDLLDPIYVVYAPKTFLLKLCIGLIAGLIAHRMGHITHKTDRKAIGKWVLGAALGGLLFNTVADPLVGYVYKLLILGKPAAQIALTWNVLSTGINTVISTAVSVIVYMALLPSLKKAGLFFTIGEEKSRME